MKGLAWFRMYVEFLDDPKMIAISFEDQRHFIGLCALKAAGVLDSTDDPKMLDRLVAQKLWLDFATIDQVKDRLVNGELISENWQPLAWDRRQRRSDADPTAAERQRSKRAKDAADRRVKAAQAEALRGVTDDVTRDVTRVSRSDVTNVTRTETEVDTDTDTEKQQTRASVTPPDDTDDDTDVDARADLDVATTSPSASLTPDTVPIAVPPPSAGVDAERLVIDDRRAEVGIRAYLAVFVAAGYELRGLVDERAIATMTGWARAGLSPMKVEQELISAGKASEGPIRAPVRYLAAKLTALPPRMKAGAEGSSERPDNSAYEAAAAKKLEAMNREAASA